MTFWLYLVTDFSSVIGSWMLLAKIPSRIARVLLGAGALALFASPTVVAGHGGAYIGPALFIGIVGRDIEIFRDCVLPIVVGWIGLLLLGLLVSWRASILAGNQDAT